MTTVRFHGISIMILVIALGHVASKQCATDDDASLLQVKVTSGVSHRRHDDDVDDDNPIEGIAETAESAFNTVKDKVHNVANREQEMANHLKGVAQQFVGTEKKGMKTLTNTEDGLIGIAKRTANEVIGHGVEIGKTVLRTAAKVAKDALHGVSTVADESAKTANSASDDVTHMAEDAIPAEIVTQDHYQDGQKMAAAMDVKQESDKQQHDDDAKRQEERQQDAADEAALKKLESEVKVDS
eukprot:gnl/TRDRNA2_/TRDRNA2_80339_c1_seq1.p1 gnl/TRDRNA2_/TRDRNA2_80339_c1~~gnl/TRDRNA2_/TRDRNA2_80339_c1_seq1.p1  ORF type:complete len:241 (-),score=48.36 gnl/TRDRNA2_/TRDRNA2_80339_c1_seq1:23-745(-)